jgi:mRNA-degrading endonuclease RelE of RelBE toxin-antitoxin system
MCSSARNRRGDVKQLEGELESYSRLRAGSYRVIFAIRAEAGERHRLPVHRAPRHDHYEMFAEHARRQMEED